MIKLENVNKTYDNHVVALGNVNLHIEKGDFVFLVGPSGAGKSTLIKLLFKEIEPTRNLDPDTAMEIMNTLIDINRAGTTILMATHAKDIVDMMKKRVIAIEKGVIVRDEARGKYGYES